MNANEVFTHFFDELGLKWEVYDSPYDVVSSNNKELFLDINVSTRRWRCVDFQFADGSVRIYDVEYELMLNMHDAAFLEKLKAIFSSKEAWRRIASKIEV